MNEKDRIRLKDVRRLKKGSRQSKLLLAGPCQVLRHLFSLFQVVIAQESNEFHNRRSAPMEAGELAMSAEGRADDVVNHAEAAVLALCADPRPPHDIFVQQGLIFCNY